MAAIRLKKKIESENLYLPELKPLIGKTVEIVVQEFAEGNLEPYADFFALAGEDVVDPDAYKNLRNASMI